MDSKSAFDSQFFKDRFGVGENFARKSAVRVTSHKSINTYLAEQFAAIPDFDSAVMKGRCKPERDLVFIQEHGTKWLDALWTGYFWLLISDHLATGLKDAGVSGWSLLPAVVYSKNKSIPGNYHLLEIRGRCSAIDESRSTRHVFKSPYSGVMCAEYIGYYFDPTSWDGSDIFGPEQGCQMFVTAKAKAVFESYRTDNILFTALEEIRYSRPHDMILE